MLEPLRHASRTGLQRVTPREPVAVAVLVVLGIAAVFTPQDRGTTTYRIPASVYPPGAHITYRPVLSNAEMDCLWGFFCEGNVPLFHFDTQDQLHRLAGWGQFAGIQHQGRTTMAFELFVSQYDPVPDDTRTPWSRHAFQDLKAASRAHGYVAQQHPTPLLPAARQGSTLVAVHHVGDQSLVIMATWSGTLEIEGIALYDDRLATNQQTARSSLMRQIRLAASPPASGRDT